LSYKFPYIEWPFREGSQLPAAPGLEHYPGNRNYTCLFLICKYNIPYIGHLSQGFAVMVSHDTQDIFLPEFGEALIDMVTEGRI
jgi:hypothetical protein